MRRAIRDRPDKPGRRAHRVRLGRRVRLELLQLFPGRRVPPGRKGRPGCKVQPVRKARKVFPAFLDRPVRKGRLELIRRYQVQPGQPVRSDRLAIPVHRDRPVPIRLYPGHKGRLERRARPVRRGRPGRRERKVRSAQSDRPVPVPAITCCAGITASRPQILAAAMYGLITPLLVQSRIFTRASSMRTVPGYSGCRP